MTCDKNAEINASFAETRRNSKLKPAKDLPKKLPYSQAMQFFGPRCTIYVNFDEFVVQVIEYQIRIISFTSVQNYGHLVLTSPQFYFTKRLIVITLPSHFLEQQIFLCTYPAKECPFLMRCCFTSEYFQAKFTFAHRSQSNYSKPYFKEGFGTQQHQLQQLLLYPTIELCALLLLDIFLVGQIQTLNQTKQQTWTGHQTKLDIFFGAKNADSLPFGPFPSQISTSERKLPIIAHQKIQHLVPTYNKSAFKDSIPIFCHSWAISPLSQTVPLSWVC